MHIPRVESPKHAGFQLPSLVIFNSIPRLNASLIPNVRLKPSIFSDSCVASQFFNLDSNGCAESGAETIEVDLAGPTPARSVSWSPGAEGAEREEGRLLMEVVWFDGGAIRMADWREG
jgi:hypothetical protein